MVRLTKLTQIYCFKIKVLSALHLSRFYFFLLRGRLPPMFLRDFPAEGYISRRCKIQHRPKAPFDRKCHSCKCVWFCSVFTLLLFFSNCYCFLSINPNFFSVPYSFSCMGGFRCSSVHNRSRTVVCAHGCSSFFFCSQNHS